jgi:hypothetical protein
MDVQKQNGKSVNGKYERGKQGKMLLFAGTEIMQLMITLSVVIN